MRSLGMLRPPSATDGSTRPSGGIGGDWKIVKDLPLSVLYPTGDSKRLADLIQMTTAQRKTHESLMKTKAIRKFYALIQIRKCAW
jgi:hypothetical protein